MKLQEMCYISQAVAGFSGFFSAYGSFGIVDGSEADLQKITPTNDGFCADYPAFSAVCRCESLENGVYLRRDRLTARESGLTLGGYAARFFLEGGDYEVYTQHSTWQHESCGGWQTLITGIEIANRGNRTTDGAAPMAVIRNKGNGRMTVFHLLPNARWKIRITRAPMFDKFDGVLIELGLHDHGLQLVCNANECIEMPAIFFYQTDNARDFDAWKLHAAFHTLFPRRRLPILYNTWLCCFDRISAESVCQQADAAAELGIEMFLVDAGWFGETVDWSENIGAWRENRHTGFCGKMAEVADYIRSKGLTFGLWLEPERALAKTSAVQAHPDYFLCGNDGNCFLDFANKEAVDYIFGVICELVETYRPGFLKFDFNATLATDPHGSGFYRYFQGQKALIRAIRAQYPEIYLTNCASGGTRMELAQQTLFDSVWISDNQSPLDCVRIFKDTALRLPPSSMEKWDVRSFCDGFPVYASDETATLPLSCDNATWTSLVTVSAAYTHAYIQGGAMGFSADLTAYPPQEKQALKALIAQYKKDREFYQTAVLRILHDTENITVVQYSDVGLSQIVIHAFFKKSFQHTLTVYPVLQKDRLYGQDGQALSGAALMADGLILPVGDNTCVVRTLQAQ